MGRPLLFLRLEGPLQAWGLRARWGDRDSGEEPSKSGVIGLLGCALGYPTGDRRLQDLDGQLLMGVRVERPGSRMTDFQTISGQIATAEGKTKGTDEEPSTILSPREYIQDAAFLVVLDGPAVTLQECAAALAHPTWPVYLGRKSCPPTRPVLDGIVDTYGSMEDALACHPWHWQGWSEGDDQPERLRCIREEANGESLRPDRIRANPARMYDSRAVRIYQTNFPGVANERKGVDGCTSADSC